MFWLLFITLIICGFAAGFIRNKRIMYFISAGCFIGVIIVFCLSFYPVKTIEYQKNLNENYVFNEEKPFSSLKIEKDANYSKRVLRFVSYKNNIMNPSDSLLLRKETQTIKFKKGTKNCIHYKKEVNIFGDISKFADNIIIEYKDK